MTLVNSLTSHPERRSDLGPAPPLRRGVRHGGVLEAIRLPAKRDHGRKGIARILRQGKGLQLATHRVNRS